MPSSSTTDLQHQHADYVGLTPLSSYTLYVSVPAISISVSRHFKSICCTRPRYRIGLCYATLLLPYLCSWDCDGLICPCRCEGVIPISDFSVHWRIWTFDIVDIDHYVHYFTITPFYSLCRHSVEFPRCVIFSKVDEDVDITTVHFSCIRILQWVTALCILLQVDKKIWAKAIRTYLHDVDHVPHDMFMMRLQFPPLQSLSSISPSKLSSAALLHTNE